MAMNDLTPQLENYRSDLVGDTLLDRLYLAVS